MTAALLDAHGVASGACVSPHFRRWAERVLIGGAQIAPADFAAAMARVAETVPAANRTFEQGDEVTQFEAATAGAFVALAAARMQAGVIEAGLGGRLDATNVIPSKVTVLTSIGLDHTEFLGETLSEIAAEKLAVLRDGSTLVTGALDPAIAEQAAAAAGEHGAELIVAPEDPGPEIELRAAGSYQRRNFALAMAAARAFLGRLDEGLCASVARAVSIPGRLELIDGDPPVILDAAHNPAGAEALALALPDLPGKAPIAVLAVLAGKDAPAMLSALAPALERAICSEVPPAALEHAGRPGAHSIPASELSKISGVAGLAAESVPELGTALARARELARAQDRPLLVAGSHYAIAAARELL